MFRNRIDAGTQLAQALEYLRPNDPLIMALPRGGVVLGLEIARRLDAELGLILVRKITHPSSPEYAIGVAAENMDVIWNEREAKLFDEEWRRAEAIAAQEVLRERREYYFEGRQEPAMSGRSVIIVDDGLATGLTMLAAIKKARLSNAARIIAAAPVASAEAMRLIQDSADEIVILGDVQDFGGYVGSQYETFEQVSDETVRLSLNQSIHYARDGP